MKILLLGCKGQLGRCLMDQLEITDHEVSYTWREQIDITDFEAPKKTIVSIAPDFIINSTAYTAVDKAEDDQQTADLINHLAVKNIAGICSNLDCWLVHVSTDYVFDGNSEVPYKEDDETNPQGVYGKTKLKGELAIQSSKCKYIILRTAWVFSEYGSNFLKTMVRLGTEHDQLSVVGDQIGCPTYAQDIAKAIVTILPQLDSQKDCWGVYHYCGDRSSSWYNFAKYIFSEAKLLGLEIPSAVHSIQTSDYPTKANRPLNSVMDCSNILRVFGVSQPDWSQGVKAVLNTMRER
jgi:dTDP-4-dehydrorhamnose reductase